ncbi:MAG: thymidylate synthase [Candidatus Aenigmarchaeota archaeon CG_4_10_14_0_8_um_filter_37_24]|nr:thymidylate synthase [Candidatus Aenigmarchaeota archaeon]OIN88317.1 MAG: thymidylate synthase [Candidatus Aenigmarchaeota archaeon CG1_02_38_14]PIV68938.1 MAG: thymidylate synthase [Candidatus Aenigmarchaeota archaeon CG01_land_8_20_14_3_00_37_9]PIW41361.1 MAG: thymidylate synthase [Candidatus Aenigmarchaeota archaeon CG15_BIG_FIL_POST_REV_8_21_14_020_37_27]PIX50390.1 MAG: thymidylate synthase [Candidatus Aenigmarchaeota archaeon CG_4_8_14_3_um_filter_37_24]PIY36455.1 MAG: thymidylate synt
MKPYLDIIKKILKEGVRKENRTGVDTIAIAGSMFEHDMSKGFPLLTTKTVPFKLVASELEFFIKGLTDKKWLQERNNHIWDEWCSPEKVPYSHDLKTKKKMLEERDLGPIYGWQWRNFGAKYASYDKKPIGEGIDQLKNLVEKLKKDPTDRRMIVMAWNPTDIKRMALPPCHYGFQVTVIKDKLNLIWNQRSVDSALGLPFNIASYGLLLHLLAKETSLKEGKLVGFLGDTHIYVNHVDGLKEQLKRKPFPLPKIKTEEFTSIFDWKYTDSVVDNYQHHPPIRFEIAV